MFDAFAKFVDNFPEWFGSVVEITARVGPLALGILLLVAVLIFAYQFNSYISSNRALRIIAGVFVLSALGVLLYFIVVSFNNWITDWARHDPTMVFVRGTVRYDLPGHNEDLDFSLNARTTEGLKERLEQFYSYDAGTKEKRVLAIAKPDTIEVTVANRPIYRQCSEDSPKEGARDRNYKTKYTISLRDAYPRKNSATTGLEIHNIDFEYQPYHGPKKRDFLKISGFDHLDSSKVTVLSVEHEPDSCLADEDKPAFFAEVVPQTAANEADNPQLAQHTFDLIRRSLMPQAFAENAGNGKDDVFRLLGSSDPSLATKARLQISQQPSSYVPLIANLLRQTDPNETAAQINALGALREAAPKTFKLPPASYRDIISLSYLSAPKLRQAARIYLVDPAVLDDEAVNITKSYYNSNGATLKANRPEQLLLLLLTVRDVYYEAGVNNLNDSRGDYGKRALVPGAIEKSIQDFQTGIDLIKDVPQSRNVPFAKAYYGMLLAMESRTAVRAAEAELGSNATSQKIDEKIYDKVKMKAPIPFTEQEKNDVVAIIERFLALVNGRTSDYFWPDHITKMNACHKNLTYDCLHGE